MWSEPRKYGSSFQQCLVIWGHAMLNVQHGVRSVGPIFQDINAWHLLRFLKLSPQVWNLSGLEAVFFQNKTKQTF